MSFSRTKSRLQVVQPLRSLSQASGIAFLWPLVCTLNHLGQIICYFVDRCFSKSSFFACHCCAKLMYGKSSVPHDANPCLRKVQTRILHERNMLAFINVKHYNYTTRCWYIQTCLEALPNQSRRKGRTWGEWLSTPTLMWEYLIQYDFIAFAWALSYLPLQ